MTFEDKRIWLREEIPIAEELMSYAPKLLQEFLDYHTDFIDGDFAKGRPYVNPVVDINKVQTRDHAWKVEGLKYTHRHAKVVLDPMNSNPEIRKRFPTAVEMTEKYGEHCLISTYSILEKNMVITRHTGIENRDNKTIRIHIPLLVPPGDIFLEVEGHEIDWSDIFAFNNQCVHSAHNYTNQRRLVYLIDITREYLGIPPGAPHDHDREFSYPPFVRGQHRVLHTCQRS